MEYTRDTTHGVHHYYYQCNHLNGDTVFSSVAIVDLIVNFNTLRMISGTGVVIHTDNHTGTTFSALQAASTP